jgi:tetratricopeptide (TPR) repeat protein
VGKSYRKLNQPEKMIDVMMRIIEAYPQSDVADDALFEMAVHYQNSDEYQTATGLYKQLSEQYPFGVSYSTGEKYIDIARECRNKMHAEISNMLAILGYTHEDNAVNITSFQRNNHLKESGVADQKTVLAVKKMFQRILDREQKKARLDKEAERYLAWAGLAGAAGLCNIFVSIGILFQARARRRVLAELRANLAELDTRAL